MTRALAIAVLAASCGSADVPASIEVWHGPEHVIGAAGLGQPDHNVMGIATGNTITWSLDDGPTQELVTGEGEWGYRRLGGPGHFNLEIPIDSIRAGGSLLTIAAKSDHIDASRTVRLERVDGDAALPHRVEWSALESVHDAGQPVDGHWEITADGIRSREPLYDRLFLIGTADWRDYDVRTSITVHRVPNETAPRSGAPGVGIIPRFAGHTVAPPRFPEADPKWGYQPIGGIVWLRWAKNGAGDAPVRQFYRGDRDESTDFEPLAGFELDSTYALRVRCATSDDDAQTTSYSLKVWPAGGTEPSEWDFTVAQTSDTARTSGGFALVAHHVDVTFGDVTVDEL